MFLFVLKYWKSVNRLISIETKTDDIKFKLSIPVTVCYFPPNLLMKHVKLVAIVKDAACVLHGNVSGLDRVVAAARTGLTCPPVHPNP